MLMHNKARQTDATMSPASNPLRDEEPVAAPDNLKVHYCVRRFERNKAEYRLS
jgi:hypothetical protein